MTEAAIPASEQKTAQGGFTRLCNECGASFQAKRSHAAFCSPEHKTAFQNRAAAEGRAIIALAKAWRLARNAKGQSAEAIATREIGGAAFSELTSILDIFTAQDRAEKRTAAMTIAYAKGLLESGKFIDRTRSY
jgi:hypothetical protein